MSTRKSLRSFCVCCARRLAASGEVSVMLVHLQVTEAGTNIYSKTLTPSQSKQWQCKMNLCKLLSLFISFSMINILLQKFCHSTKIYSHLFQIKLFHIGVMKTECSLWKMWRIFSSCLSSSFLIIYDYVQRIYGNNCYSTFVLFSWDFVWLSSVKIPFVFRVLLIRADIHYNNVKFQRRCVCRSVCLHGREQDRFPFCWTNRIIIIKIVH